MNNNIDEIAKFFGDSVKFSPVLLQIMSLRRAELYGIFNVESYLSGGSFVRKFYYTVWFNTKFLQAETVLSRSKAPGY